LGLELQLLYTDGKYQITIRNTGNFLLRIVEALFTILDTDTDSDQFMITEDDEEHWLHSSNSHNKLKHFDSPTTTDGGGGSDMDPNSDPTAMADSPLYDGLKISSLQSLSLDPTRRNQLSNQVPPGSSTSSSSKNQDGSDIECDLSLGDGAHHHFQVEDEQITPPRNLTTISGTNNHSDPQNQWSDTQYSTPEQQVKLQPTGSAINDEKHPLLRRDWLDFVNVDKSLTPLPQRQQNLLASQRAQSIDEIQPSFICFSFESPILAEYQLPANMMNELNNDDFGSTTREASENSASGHNLHSNSPHPYSYHHNNFPKEHFLPKPTTQQHLHQQQHENETMTNDSTPASPALFNKFKQQLQQQQQHQHQQQQHDEKDDEFDERSTLPQKTRTSSTATLPISKPSPLPQTLTATTATNNTTGSQQLERRELCCSFLVEIVPK
jgi:hypothetical protein